MFLKFPGLRNASVYNPEMQLTNLIAAQNQNDLSGKVLIEADISFN